MIVLLPYLWLAIFFLAPFVIVLKISLSQTVLAQPPYTPVFDLTAGWQGLKEFAAQLSLDFFVCSHPITFTWCLMSRACRWRRFRRCFSLRSAIRLPMEWPARRRRGSPSAGDGRRVAVLDLVPDPHLCLDQYSAA